MNRIYSDLFRTVFIGLAGVVLVLVFNTSSRVSAEESQPSALQASTISLLGRTQYIRSYPVISNYAGVAKEIYVHAGQYVQSQHDLLKLQAFDPNRNPLVMRNEHGPLYVVQVNIDEGQKVDKHEPIMVLASKRDLIVEAYALETQITKIHINQKVGILLDAGGTDQPLTGVIRGIHESSSNAPFYWKLEVKLGSNKCISQRKCRNLLRAGILAKVEIDL